MSILSGVNNFFGLDIGTSAIRLVELTGQGSSKSLAKYGYAPIDGQSAMSDAKSDQQKLAQQIHQLVMQSKITANNVAVGVPSSRVFTTVVDFERLPHNELDQAIRLQADSLIPTPLAESKIDWALLGDSPADSTKLEVLLTSVSNEYIETRLDMLESIGLNVIAFEPENIAMARALLTHDAEAPQMVIDMGSRSTDIVVTIGGEPRLCRSIPTGTDALIKSAMQNLSIDEKQANQFVFKFGLSKDKLEGQVYQAVIGTVELLVTDIDKSIKFIASRYPSVRIGNIVVTGGASTLPELPLYIANRFGVNVEIGNAWRNVVYPQERQNELLAVSNQFGVAAGLAERNE